MVHRTEEIILGLKYLNLSRKEEEWSMSICSSCIITEKR